MYMTGRMMHAKPGHFFDLLGAAVEICEALNANHGSAFAVSTQVGGDPSVIAASSVWASLGEYEAFVTSMQADADLMARGNEAAKLSTGAEDLIARILTPPGDRAGVSGVAMARMHMPRIAEAVPFALEVAEMAEAKTGVKVGVLHASTGDRSQIAWMTRHATLAEQAEMGETLDGDPEFMELYKRSDGLMVDGSLEQLIWRQVS